MSFDVDVVFLVVKGSFRNFVIQELLNMNVL